MIQVVAKVYSPDGNTLQGSGDVILLNASVERVLDGIGQVSCTFQLSNSRGITEMQIKRIVRIYVDDGQHSVREIATLVIDNMNDSEANGTRTVSGKDVMTLLRYKNSGFGLSYDQDSVTDIVTDLADHAGWTVTADVAAGNQDTSIRFNTTSMFKAIQSSTTPYGIHFRLNDTFKQLEIGEFGDDSGYRAVKLHELPEDTYLDESLLLIESMQIQIEGRDIVNALLPVGNGDGDAKITLEKSDRSGITSRTSPSGDTSYFVEDATSISTYGRIEAPLDTKLSPISGSSSDVLNCANAMKDVADIELARRKDPVYQYKIVCRKPSGTLRAGDKLELDYVGEIENPDGTIVNYANVSGDFWILSVKETWGLSGGKLELIVSNIDEFTLSSTTKAQVGGLETITAQNIGLKTFLYPLYATQVLRIGNTGAGSFTESIPLRIESNIYDILNCKVYVTTRPLRSNIRPNATAPATTSEVVDSHSHLVFAKTSISGFPSTVETPYLGRESAGGSGAFTYLKVFSNEKDLYTYDAANAHNHDIDPITVDIEYGFYDDDSVNNTPDTISVSINGGNAATQTAALGGTWNDGGGETTFSFECSDILKQSTIQQEHTLNFSCTGGQGELVVVITGTVLATTVNQS